MNETEIWAAKVTEAGQRISRLLTTDLKAFVRAEVRRRFVETPAVADRLDDASVARLKAQTDALADEAAARIGAVLDDAGLWLGAVPADDEAPVTSIAAIDEALDAAIADLGGFVARHGLTAEEPLAYRLPVRFIDGDNLATLTRNLWKNLARYHAAREAEADAHQASSKIERERRWDGA